MRKGLFSRSAHRVRSKDTQAPHPWSRSGLQVVSTTDLDDGDGLASPPNKLCWGWYQVMTAVVAADAVSWLPGMGTD